MNLFELFVKIGADTSEADKGIDETGKKTSGLGEKIKNGLATVGKAAVVGVTAAATGNRHDWNKGNPSICGLRAACRRRRDAF